MKKIKSFFLEHPEYIAILVIAATAATVVFFVIQFSNPEYADSLKIYFGKSITEMSIGEFVFILLIINAVFSK